MPTPPISRKVQKQLRDAFIKDLGAAWAHARRQHPDETPYAFVLYGVEGAARFTPHVLTEQGLAQVAERYVAKGRYDTPVEARRGLRYSVADSPHFDDLVEDLPSVDALCASHLADLDETAGYRILAEAAMQALIALDQRRLFGTGAEREQLLLVIITEDTDEDFSGPSARRLNPAPVFGRFEAETRVEQGTFATCHALAVSRDGRSLYASVSRNLPLGKGRREPESISEIVAFDLQFPQLRRRWTHTHHTGDAFLACAPDTGGAYALQGTRTSDGPQILLTQFAPDSSEPLRRALHEGHAKGLAVSPDGTRIAASIFGRRVHLFTNELQPVAVHETPEMPQRILFLRNGDLLLSCETALLRMDASTGSIKTALPGAPARLSTDDNEMLLALSPRPAAPGSGRESDEIEIQLLTLPALEPARTFSIPNHQLETAVLSPNGSVLACEAHECGKHRRFLVAFDSVTGRELGRRKADSTYDLAFLRDSQTLVIARSGTVADEPIDLWKLDL